MLSPEQIQKRAFNGYEVFLRSLAAGENIFPLPLFGGGLARVTDYTKTRDAIIALREHSKQAKGFGYSVEWKEQNFRRFGEQQIPATVSFATREDYTRFLGKCSEVRQFEQDCKLVQESFPELVEWIQRNPLRVVEHAGDWTGLIAVCAYLRQNGRPNCYLRELPVEVDTKFIERKRGVLGEILPIVAPGCVGDDASTFETRFGFRQKQPLIRFRALDPSLVGVGKLPFTDFAIPLDEACRMSVAAKNILVVENETTFLTLPSITNTLALLGAGDAVSLLQQMDWLKRFRIVYWGDMDTHGFESLSLLRKHYPQTESLMMDIETYKRFHQFAKKAAPYASNPELVLSSAERKLFEVLHAEVRLLEQERITLNYAKPKLHDALNARLDEVVVAP
jgi:hypothetical protein